MNQAEILRDYKALRRVSVQLHNRLVETLNSQEIGAAAAALGMRHGQRIDLETEDEIAVLMDYAIHDIFRDGRNAVDRLLDENPPPEGSTELRLLRSMQKSHYTPAKSPTPIPAKPSPPRPLPDPSPPHQKPAATTLAPAAAARNFP